MKRDYRSTFMACDNVASFLLLDGVKIKFHVINFVISSDRDEDWHVKAICEGCRGFWMTL